jgi:hypothetical protein
MAAHHDDIPSITRLPPAKLIYTPSADSAIKQGEGEVADV